MTRSTLLLATGCLVFVTPHAIAADDGSDILQNTGVHGGLAVVLGCEDAELLCKLGRAGPLLVRGFDQRPEVVEAARQLVQKRGVYGRVSVARLAAPDVPLVDGLVNLLILTRDIPGLPTDELVRVLAPRGVLVARGAGIERLPMPRRPVPGGWTLHRKPVPSEIDDWTHFRYSAQGSMVSHDLRVGPPRHLQWMDGPLYQRHHGVEPSITAAVSAHGRLFYIVDEAPQGFVGLPGEWRLVARDALNGVVLWKRDMEKWGSEAWSYYGVSHAARFNHPLHITKRLVAVGDRVYITLGFNSPISVLDAVTGKTVQTYEGTRYADEFVVDNGVLYAAVNDRPQKPWPGKGIRPEPPADPPPPSQKYIHAVEAGTGRLLWRAGPFVGNPSKIDRMASLRHLNLTVGGDGVFLVDEKETVALDRRTGARRWRSERLVPPASPTRTDPGSLYHLYNNRNLHTVVYDGGRLFVVHPTDKPSMKSTSPAIIQCLEASTGKELWRYDKATPITYEQWPDLWVIGERVWFPDRRSMTLICLDAATGSEEKKLSIEKALKVGHHHRCYPNHASVNYAVLGRRGAEFVDFSTGKLTLNHWMRSGCRVGHVLANGLVYRLPDHCQCYTPFQPRGFLALRANETPAPEPPDDKRLIKGPAYGEPLAGPESDDRDWATFRHDPMRSSMATCGLPEQLRSAWSVHVGSRLTPPVIADGRVFVAAQDEHRLVALNAESGAILWTFVAEARIDSPPTVWRGRVLFGGHDGWVYCLRVADGRLIWRFLAAPNTRQLVAHGQLESAWPVGGSVLLADGKVYFTAGRTSLLDGGVFAYVLDAATGRQLDRQQIHEVQTETRTTGKLPQGALADILYTDGESVYLRRRRLELSPAVTEVGPSELASVRPVLCADNGFTTDRWFHRVFWTLKSTSCNAKGNLIAFDAQRAYVAAANLPGGTNQTFHVPFGGNVGRVAGRDGDGPSWLANPNIQVGGAILFAARTRADRVPPVPDRSGRTYGKATQRSSPAIWRHDHFPVYPWTMVCGDGKLIVAGPTAKLDPTNPWAVFEGKGVGELHVLEAHTGKVLFTEPLASAPVWNGAAAARGRVFLSLKDGSVVCHTASQ